METCCAPSNERLILGTLLLAGGAVLTYSSPSLFALGFVVLVGYLVLLGRSRTVWQSWLVLLAFYGVQSVHSNWDYFQDGTFTPLQAVLVTALGAGYALMVAVALGCTRKIHRHHLVAVAGIVYLFETLSEMAFSGNYRLPYSLGYFLLDTPLQGLYAVMGVRASVVVVAWMVHLWARQHITGLLAVCSVALLPWALSGLPQSKVAAQKFTVLQTGLQVPLFRDYTPARAKQQYQRMDQLARQHADGVLLFPETAVPETLFYHLPNVQLNRALQGRTALLGGIYSGPEGTTSVVVQHRGGTLEPVYHKHILVPFTEDQWLFEGPSTPLATVNGVKLGIAVCFEAVLSAPLREQVKSGAELLYVPTNTESPIANTFQTIALRARALENHRTLLVASLPGHSMVIGANGQVQQRAVWQQQAALEVQPALYSQMTPFSRFGQWMVLVALAALAHPFLGILGVGLRNKVRVARLRQGDGVQAVP